MKRALRHFWYFLRACVGKDPIPASRIVGQTFTFFTVDHPCANGRQPQPGEVEYGLSFSIDDGTIHHIRFGQAGYEALTQMVLDMMTNAPSYSDGSMDRAPKL